MLRIKEIIIQNQLKAFAVTAIPTARKKLLKRALTEEQDVVKNSLCSLLFNRGLCNIKCETEKKQGNSLVDKQSKAIEVEFRADEKTVIDPSKLI